MLQRTAKTWLTTWSRANVYIHPRKITGAWLRVSRWEENAMISLEDCIGLCGLSKEEVLALAEHEHMGEINAAALAQYLLGQPDGCRKISAMIADAINSSILRGDCHHADELLTTLEGFVSSHPEALASRRAQACLTVRLASSA